jgi:hypothetical protein
VPALQPDLLGYSEDFIGLQTVGLVAVSELQLGGPVNDLLELLPGDLARHR